MAAGKSSRLNRKYKTKYRIRNWSEYERAGRSRGDNTIRLMSERSDICQWRVRIFTGFPYWLSEEAIAAWTPQSMASAAASGGV